MSRQTKTPQQRAQEALDVEVRRVARLTAKRKALKAELDAVDTERDQAIVRRDYLAQHPDLQQNPTTTTGDTPA
jgi:glutamine synthetase type III